jgi:hypothetical protein
VHRPSIWKAAGIVVNLGIVAYLAYLLRRRVRGPRMLEPKNASERVRQSSASAKETMSDPTRDDDASGPRSVPRSP